MGRLIFITGGARSGKSSYALQMGGEISRLSPAGRKVFIATAEAFDEEMKERIDMHRRYRPAEWDTMEEPLRLCERLQKIDSACDVVIVDCLTLWLSNMLLGYEDVLEDHLCKVKEEIEHLAAVLKTVSFNAIIISNEVGLGIVPENKMSRLFRDLSGWMNQKVASVADEVYMVLCGLPVRIK